MVGVAIALGLAIVLGAAGDIILSKGMQRAGEVRVRRIADIPFVFRLVFTQPLILLGILSMAGYFGSYMAALSMVDVSVANPLTALSYLLATAYARLYMQEKMPPLRAAGIILIVVGAILVGVSS